MPSDLIPRLRQYRGESFETTECYNGLRDEAADALEAAYRCIIDGTRAFCPPIENGADIRRWFDEHDATIQAVLAWKEAQKQTSVCSEEPADA